MQFKAGWSGEASLRRWLLGSLHTEGVGPEATWRDSGPLVAMWQLHLFIKPFQSYPTHPTPTLNSVFFKKLVWLETRRGKIPHLSSHLQLLLLRAPPPAEPEPLAPPLHTKGTPKPRSQRCWPSAGRLLEDFCFILETLPHPLVHFGWLYSLYLIFGNWPGIPHNLEDPDNAMVLSASSLPHVHWWEPAFL